MTRTPFLNAHLTSRTLSHGILHGATVRTRSLSGITAVEGVRIVD
jgi:hypothetical protein